MKVICSSCLLVIVLTSSLHAQQRQQLVSQASATDEPDDSAPSDHPNRIARAGDLLERSANPLFGVRAEDHYISSPFLPQAIGYNNRGQYWKDPKDQAAGNTQDIYHQPLIQIKVRIIEVVREDNLAAKTVLDIVRDRGMESLVKRHTLNGGNQGSTTSTRFPETTLPDVSDLNTKGAGGIINITTNQLNIIGEFLSTEFKADLVTCPQVVTLNGQKVQLLSGANVPFQLGQSVLQDGTLAVQNTFYKHVGTNLTVTPRIVNWGPRGEGHGQSPVMARDILDWNGVAKFLTDHDLLDTNEPDNDRGFFAKYAGTNVLMPITDQNRLLNALNQYDRFHLISLLAPDQRLIVVRPADCIIEENGCPCNWNPADCTLDVELVLRQSNPTSSLTLDLTGDKIRTDVSRSENVGAAIANVVQLKNGHGAVIAGLIGERDIKATSKVPILGDIPVIGAAFRSKATNRQKTEIVIFLEAEILASDPHTGMAQAAHDFELTRTYLHGDVLCNPLEAGLQRVGIGSYLPPRSCDERIYWERLGRKVQKSSTAVGDIFR